MKNMKNALYGVPVILALVGCAGTQVKDEAYKPVIKVIQYPILEVPKIEGCESKYNDNDNLDTRNGQNVDVSNMDCTKPKVAREAMNHLMDKAYNWDGEQKTYDAKDIIEKAIVEVPGFLEMLVEAAGPDKMLSNKEADQMIPKSQKLLEQRIKQMQYNADQKGQPYVQQKQIPYNSRHR
ncbi:hypothetical protein COV93_08700 [Candidatus Woesearchaeota archaeon CG11_big_fil_rev_8_21_14_0_20_43_8]|nr:MAG: hypothetical protein COV93_08700 [Candidatus Woesearchaeota archaeon CG11_big_fil_rev_8_21_14_0_20_43_8]